LLDESLQRSTWESVRQPLETARWEPIAETGESHSPNETQKLSVRLMKCSNSLSRPVVV